MRPQLAGFLGLEVSSGGNKVTLGGLCSFCEIFVSLLLVTRPYLGFFLLVQSEWFSRMSSSFLNVTLSFLKMIFSFLSPG